MEQKPKQLLIIEPANELRFCGPFTRPVVAMMKLTNPNDKPVYFKIKTTAPKRYCVRPNFGLIAPCVFAKIEIVLQPFVYDANEKNKHKFMVQCLETEAECDDFNQLWKEAQPEQLMEAKLKCVFELPPITSGGDTSGSAPTEMIKDDVKKEEKPSNLQTSEQSETLVYEIRKLREENNNLLQEKINLQDQVIRLRCMSSATKPKLMDEPYAPVMTEKQIPTFFIAISIAAAIFGLLLGKYLL